MARDRKPAPVLITDAESQAAQLRHREIRYVNIARILGVPTSALLGGPPSESDEAGSPAIPAIHRVLLG